MTIAQVPANEQERLKALGEYFILDTLPEDNFDDITHIAAEICDAPIALVSIFDADRQWFKSSYGINISEASRDNAICSPAARASGKVVIIPNLGKDEYFRTDPLVTGKPYAQFYAGVQLVNPEGYVLGALCVLDIKPRTLTTRQTETLQSLGRQTVSLLELRRKDTQLKQKQAELNGVVSDLEKIAHLASHDLKSPLNNIISLTHLLKDEHAKQLDEEGNEYISFLNAASYQLSDLVSGIVSYTRTAQLSVEQKEVIDVAELLDEISGLINLPEHATIKYDKNSDTLCASRPALKQVLLQLMQNAVLYNEKPEVVVAVTFRENDRAYTFEVTDNGPGIADEDKEKIFNLFERLQKKIKDGESMGIGLAITKRLVEKMGGEMQLETEVNKGSTFLFTIPK